MIKIVTITLKEHKDYDEMKTSVEIEGTGEVIKEEIKTLLLHCKNDDNLRHIVICALSEVLHDN